ncbi:MAG: hypothetical protein M3270_07980 [Thermoproteota archaeon]|nr:hypothetical protein [Thermoproteota archaeon]
MTKRRVRNKIKKWRIEWIVCGREEGKKKKNTTQGKQGFKSNSLHVLAPPPHTIILMIMMMEALRADD